jgi:hypothetical protein
MDYVEFRHKKANIPRDRNFGNPSFPSLLVTEGVLKQNSDGDN